MNSIDTLTVNPTIDIAYEVERLEPVRKLRAAGERHDPGGGGINVARVFVRLGGNARCHYMAGGPTGVALDALLDQHQLVKACTPIAGSTRISTTVFERVSGREYRVVAQGPEIEPGEWGACLDRLGRARADYIVASGSLARGLPDDFYARAARAARDAGARFVLDSSGVGLAGALAAGGVYLVKPSLDELSGLVGEELREDAVIAEAAQGIVRRGGAEHVVVTMADRGAMLATADGVVRLPALPVTPASTVGAGDSFLAAMVHALAGGRGMTEALRFGIAAGAAAVATPGTDLARAEDIRRLVAEVSAPA